MPSPLTALRMYDVEASRLGPFVARDAPVSKPGPAGPSQLWPILLLQLQPVLSLRLQPIFSIRCRTRHTSRSGRNMASLVPPLNKWFHRTQSQVSYFLRPRLACPDSTRIRPFVVFQWRFVITAGSTASDDHTLEDTTTGSSATTTAHGPPRPNVHYAGPSGGARGGGRGHGPHPLTYHQFFTSI